MENSHYIGPNSVFGRKVQTRKCDYWRMRTMLLSYCFPVFNHCTIMCHSKYFFYSFS